MADLSKLSAEFPPEAIHWRVQGQPYKGRNGYAAMALAYIDARDVMDRLDEVCGPDGWQSEISETASGRVICRLGIRTDSGWVWKTDGAGGTQVEAEKGGISDSLKRAAVSWGVGRYLYRLDSPWVKCEVREKGGKVYWKAWAEDPWSKVKRTKFVPPSPTEPEPAEPVAQLPPSEKDATQFPYAAARDDIKARISRCVSQDDLAQVWRSEAKTLSILRDDRPPMFKELEKAKNEAKAKLQPHTPTPEHEPAEPY